MEFDHLKGFYHVAKLGSFTEAAARLYLTQPAISLQIKALEREVGERLFDRIGRSIRLTSAGEALLKQVEELIGKLDEVQRVVDEIKNLDRGRLRLGASDTTSIYFLPELLKSFRKLHPKIELSITSLMSPEVIRKVLDREIDLGIITLPCESRAKLQLIPLFQHRLVCIICRDHPLSARKVIDISEMCKEPLILLEQQSVTRKLIDGYFSKADHPLRPIMELSNFEITKRYVAAGLGISLVPEAAVAPPKDGFCAVALRQPLTVEVGVALRQDGKLSQAARSFLDLARTFFQGGEQRQRAARP
jgi:DNA-binding transcriptional LysR family regulator